MTNLEAILKNLIEYPAFIPEDADEKASKVLEAANSLGLDCSLCGISVGPTYTLIELTPTAGTRISKVRKLEENISLYLLSVGARVIAPVPGKGTIGIEIPNDKPQIAGLGTLLHSPEFTESTAVLPIAVGMDVEGKGVVADLTKMHHLLIGGATGQGKSIFLNSLIVSLLASKEPGELKFMLIDPKMVEFAQYRSLANSYLLRVEGIGEPVISNTRDTKVALNALCSEMDRRYSLLINAGVRTIADYNAKVRDKLPYIVVVIDEFADLIMTLGKDIETPTARLAQMARAAGIHVVLATQRPSKDVITGVIKANFPARIAFRTAQRTDSKTILDQEDASKLLGRGDMLFSHNGCITRLQVAFVDTLEIDNVIKSISEIGGEQGSNFMIKGVEMTENLTSPKPQAQDSLFDQAVKFLASQESFSTTRLQRKFKIGYNRACKLIDELEVAGIVGPAQGGKPREILINPDGTSNQKQHTNKGDNSAGIDSQLNQNQTFDNFCCEYENGKEVSIALTFANSASANIPLVIYGESGSGKTHLVNAIGNKVKTLNPSSKVVYVTGRQFLDQFGEATKRNSISQFYAFYKSLDMLVIDDCQYLSSMLTSQQALLYVIDALHQKNVKLVFASDSHPSKLFGFDPKLVSRLNKGIILGLLPPNKTLRFQILEQLNKRYENGLTSNQLRQISKSGTSIFEMLGQFNTLIAYKESSDGDLDNSMLSKIVGPIPEEKHSTQIE